MVHFGEEIFDVYFFPFAAMLAHKSQEHIHNYTSYYSSFILYLPIIHVAPNRMLNLLWILHPSMSLSYGIKENTKGNILSIL